MLLLSRARPGKAQDLDGAVVADGDDPLVIKADDAHEVGVLVVEQRLQASVRLAPLNGLGGGGRRRRRRGRGGVIRR